MIEIRNVETAPGMVFDVSVAGSGVAPLVLMPHGSGVSRHFWNAQMRAAAAGFYAAGRTSVVMPPAHGRIRRLSKAIGSCI